jgi:hypothetical protein
MPKMSRTSTPPIDQGGAGTEWRAVLDGYTTSFVKTPSAADLTDLLKGLPGDVCPSAHWGYVFKGRLWWRHADREESIGPGEAFYVEPGHTAGADAGSEFLVFSPTEILDAVEAHMMRRAREGATASG